MQGVVGQNRKLPSSRQLVDLRRQKKSSLPSSRVVDWRRSLGRRAEEPLPDPLPPDPRSGETEGLERRLCLVTANIMGATLTSGGGGAVVTTDGTSTAGAVDDGAIFGASSTTEAVNVGAGLLRPSGLGGQLLIDMDGPVVNSCGDPLST